MSNKDLYSKVFEQTFAVSESDLPALKYQSIPQWDSVGHMSLIAALEDIFNIEMNTDDIIDLSSFEKGKEILVKYGLEF
jgi:acyl carrier protein